MAVEENFDDLVFLTAREQVIEELKDFFMLKELNASKRSGDNENRRPVHTHRLSIASQSSTDKAVYYALQRMPNSDDVDPHVYIDAMQEIRGLKYIKDHPDAVNFVMRMLKQRSPLVRTKALQILPELVKKGERTAILAAADRLKDWNAEVRHAAVESLQDSAGDWKLLAPLPAFLLGKRTSESLCRDVGIKNSAGERPSYPKQGPRDAVRCPRALDSPKPIRVTPTPALPHPPRHPHTREDPLGPAHHIHRPRDRRRLLHLDRPRAARRRRPRRGGRRGPLYRAPELLRGCRRPAGMAPDPPAGGRARCGRLREHPGAGAADAGPGHGPPRRARDVLGGGAARAPRLRRRHPHPAGGRHGPLPARRAGLPALHEATGALPPPLANERTWLTNLGRYQ